VALGPVNRDLGTPPVCIQDKTRLTRQRKTAGQSKYDETDQNHGSWRLEFVRRENIRNENNIYPPAPRL